MQAAPNGRTPRYTLDVNIRIDPESVSRLDSLAMASGTSRAHEIRTAVRRYLADHEREEAARDAAYLADIQPRTPAAN